MNNLERHITRLLLDNDCVIVPGFGGFMAHHMNAYYNEEDGRFYPPRRTIGFNSQLKMNDSLLAQSYIEAYDTSYPEAMGRIEADVEELKQAIEACGEYAINGIGTLRMADDGRYCFEPCLAGLLTPTLFALDAVDIRRTLSAATPQTATVGSATAAPQGKPNEEDLTQGRKTQDITTQGVASQDAPADTQQLAPAADASATEETAGTAGKTVSLASFAAPEADSRASGETAALQQDDEDDTAEHTRRKVVPMWVRDIAVACLVLAAVLLLPSPTGKQAKSLSGSSIDASLLLKVMPKDLTTGAPESGALKAEKPIGADSINSMAEKAALSEKAEKAEATVKADNKESKAPKGYTIVLASKVSKAGAERYVGQLHKRGYADATVVSGSEGPMVVYGSYDSHEKARDVRSKLTDDIEFADSWIMHIK